MQYQGYSLFIYGSTCRFQYYIHTVVVLWPHTIVFLNYVHLTVKSVNPQTAKKKMHLKMSSAEVVCYKYLPSIADELSIETNSVDPEQQSDLGPHCLP